MMQHHHDGEDFLSYEMPSILDCLELLKTYFHVTSFLPALPGDLPDS